MGYLAYGHPFLDGNGRTIMVVGSSKKLDNHVAAVALYVAHYNLCLVTRSPPDDASESARRGG